MDSHSKNKSIAVFQEFLNFKYKKQKLYSSKKT